METGEAEQLDILLNQCAKVLNKNSDIEETDVYTTIKMKHYVPITLL